MTANSDIRLHPDEDIYIRRDDGQNWVHFDNSEERLGVGLTSPLNLLHVQDSSLNLPASALHVDVVTIEAKDASLGLYSSDYGPAGSQISLGEIAGGVLVDKWTLLRETTGKGASGLRIVYGTDPDPWANISNTVAYFNDDGNVGIGTAMTDAKLDVNGSLKVRDAYIGDISSSSGSDGAPFPRPAYNSGWTDIAPGEFLVLTHDIGGDSNNYVVDLQFKSDDPSFGIHNFGIGGNFISTADHDGAHYMGLTSTSIAIVRFTDDLLATRIRVRIWVIE